MYNSRISIIYKDIFIYSFSKEKLAKIDISKYGFSGTGDILLKPNRKNILSLDDFSCSKDELVSFVEQITKALKKDALIIADTVNYNENLKTDLVYFFGDSVKTLYIDDIIEDKIKISNITKWLELVKNNVSDKELKKLRDFGYKLKIDKKNNNIVKKYNYKGLVFAGFKNDENATEAYKKWIIYADEFGKEYSIFDMKNENNPLGNSDTEYKKFLIDDIPLSKEECSEYLKDRIEVLKKGCAIALTYNGVSNNIYICYYFGDKIKEIIIEDNEIKSLIKEGCTISECVSYNNIEKLFKEKYSVLNSSELERIKECCL